MSTKLRRRLYADVIVGLCLLACCYITGDVLSEYHRMDIAMSEGVIRELRLMWTGELLIIALRQIFGSDFVVKAIKAKNNIEEDIGV